MPYDLPPGTIYPEPVNLISSEKNQVFIRKNSNARNSTLYRLNNDEFQF